MLWLRKILIVTPGLVEVPPGRIPGGIQEIDYQVANQFAKRFDVTIISPFYSHFTTEKRFGNLTIKYVFHPALNRSSKVTSFRLFMESLVVFNFSILAFLEVLKQKESEVVIFSDRQTGLLPCLGARLLRKVVIFSEGSSYPWYWSKYFIPSPLSKGATLFFGRLACSLSHKIRAQSISIKEGMIRVGVKRDKITLIPGGVDTNLFTPSDGQTLIDHQFTVGFVGRLTDEKGAPFLWEIARKNGSRFLIVGSGAYEDQISSIENAEVYPSASRSKLAKLMNQCDAFVAPHPDPSLTILEEMACAKPVIAQDSVDMRSIITNMFNGILCKPNYEEFHKAITLLKEKPSLREELGRNARKTAVALSWKNIGELWVELIMNANK